MDKYKTKMTINKWFSYIKLEQLSFDSRQAIEQFEVSPASEHDHEHLEVFINEPLATYFLIVGILISLNSIKCIGMGISSFLGSRRIRRYMCKAI